MSKKTLVLDNPIKINGDMVSEFDYDVNEITIDLFSAACEKSAEASKNKTMKFKETDYSLHLHLGMAAVIAVNPHIDFSDLARVKGLDLVKFGDIGFLFTVGKSAEPSEQNNSGEQSESIPATSTQASGK